MKSLLSLGLLVVSSASGQAISSVVNGLSFDNLNPGCLAIVFGTNLGNSTTWLPPPPLF
jgi:hypothetical protein